MYGCAGIQNARWIGSSVGGWRTSAKPPRWTSTPRSATCGPDHCVFVTTGGRGWLDTGSFAVLVAEHSDTGTMSPLWTCHMHEARVRTPRAPCTARVGATSSRADSSCGATSMAITASRACGRRAQQGGRSTMSVWQWHTWKLSEVAFLDAA